MRKFWTSPAMPTAPPQGARVPECVHIGGVEIRPAMVRAPMSGGSDTAFRRFVREMGGGGLLMTAFTSADGPRPRPTMGQRPS